MLLWDESKFFPVQVNVRTEVLPGTSRICSNCLRFVLGEEQGKSRVHCCCERSTAGRKGDRRKGLTAASSFHSHHIIIVLPPAALHSAPPPLAKQMVDEDAHAPVTPPQPALPTLSKSPGPLGKAPGWEMPPESAPHPRRDPRAGRAAPPVLCRRPPRRVLGQQLPWSYWKPQWTAEPLLFPLFALNWLLFNDGKDKKDVLGHWLTTSSADENKENASCLLSIPIHSLGNCWSKPSL